MNDELRKIEIPYSCPSCEDELEEVNGQLFCRNPECQAKSLLTIVHFCKVMKIKGLGEKTVEKLGFESINDMYTTHPDEYCAILGDKVGIKIVNEIEKSLSADLVLLLEAFNIPQMGSVASKKLCGIIRHINEISEETCKQAGLGPSVTAKLLNWWELNKEDILRLPFKFTSSLSKPTNVVSKLKVTVCITGKLNDFKNRDDARQLLESLGFNVTDTISGKTTYLICEDDKHSTKTEKAQSLQIPILTIKQLLERYNIHDNIQVE